MTTLIVPVITHVDGVIRPDNFGHDVIFSSCSRGRSDYAVVTVEGIPSEVNALKGEVGVVEI